MRRRDRSTSAKSWGNDANGKIAAGKDGFGCRYGFDFIHAERLLDYCRKAHYLRFRRCAEGRTMR